VKQSSPAEAVAALHLASQKYAESLQLHPRNPQALNNWGLVLQVGWEDACSCNETAAAEEKACRAHMWQAVLGSYLQTLPVVPKHRAS
jgi:Tfp pilus assembly protein PilF